MFRGLGDVFKRQTVEREAARAARAGLDAARAGLDAARAGMTIDGAALRDQVAALAPMAELSGLSRLSELSVLAAVDGTVNTPSSLGQPCCPILHYRIAHVYVFVKEAGPVAGACQPCPVATVRLGERVTGGALLPPAGQGSKRPVDGYRKPAIPHHRPG